MIISVPGGGGAGTGVRFILASQIAGIKLNSNVETGGGLEDTAALQAVLNTATATQPLMLIMDGAALVGQLVIKSHTVVQCLTKSCGFYFKAGGGSSIFRNANPTRATRIDSDIAFIGGTYNGNQINQPHHDPVSGTWTVGIGMYGITNLTYSGLTVKNVRTFALHTANWANATLKDCLVRNNSGTINQDGPHFNGPGEVCAVYNLDSSAFDDALAFNADDLADGGDNPGVSGPNALGPWVGEGDIVDVDIANLTLSGSLFGLRLLSCARRMDRVRVRGIHGSVMNYAVVMDWFFARPGALRGNFGDIDLQDVSVSTLTPVGSFQSGIVIADGVFDRLRVGNLLRNNPADSRSSLRIKDQSAIKLLEIDGLSVLDYQAAEPAATLHILIEGQVGTLLASNWAWSRKTGFVAKTPLELMTLAGTGAIANRIGSLYGASGGGTSGATPNTVTYKTSQFGAVVGSVKIERLPLGTTLYTPSVLSTTGTLTLPSSPALVTLLSASGNTVAQALLRNDEIYEYTGVSQVSSLNTLFSDDFNRADGALGANWIITQAGPTIAGNRAVGSSGLGYATAIFSGTALEVSATCGPSGGLLFNYQDANNHYLFQRQGDPKVSIYKRVGGTYTQILIDFPVSGSSSVLKVVRSGTAVEFFIDGVSKGTSNDSTFTGGASGIQLINSGFVDDFAVRG